MHTRPLHSPGLHQLAWYINEKQESLENEPHFAIRYNTTGETAKTIAQDFQSNNALIKKRKSKQVGLYHTILSFHPKEKSLLDNEKLFAFAKAYCDLIEADKAVVFGRPHFEKHNVHLHFMSSASELGSGKSRRISKARLKEIQVAMNRFQQREYPELKHSLLYLPELKKTKSVFEGIPLSEKFRESDGSLRVKARGQVSKLDSIRKILADLAKTYPEKAVFLTALEQEGIITYQYRNRMNGILIGGKKYRWKRLGVDLENLPAFSRTHALEQLQTQEKQQQKSLNTRQR